MPDIKLEDLNGEARDMAEVIGVEATLKLHELYGGTTVYFRVLARLTNPSLYRQIREDYYVLGKSIDDIRRERGYTEKWIREIIFGEGDPRQAILFEKLSRK